MNRDAGTRRTNEGAGELSHPLATLHTTELLIRHIGISHTDAIFDAPTVAEGLMVTVADSSRVELTAQYLVGKGGDERDLPDVIVSVLSVYTQKMALELAAEPIAYFGFCQIEVELHVLREFPSIVGEVYAERELA